MELARPGGQTSNSLLEALTAWNLYLDTNFSHQAGASHLDG
jgi:hypothetical protein